MPTCLLYLQPANQTEAPASRDSLLTEADLNAGVEFAKKAAHHYCQANPTVDQGQVESSAVRGAYEAWQKYDPGRNAKWTTYLTNMVRWHIQKGLRPTKERTYNKFRAQNKVVPLDDHALLHDDSKISHHDIIADPTSLQQNERTEWREVLKLLPQRECWIIVQRYFQGRSCNEIARQLGGEWTGMKVWRLEQAALKRLRIMLKV